MKRTMHLLGPYANHVMTMADADAATGVTDGWARDITTASEPFDASGEMEHMPWPATLKSWLVTAGWPASLVYPNAITLALVSIDKTNPAVIEVSLADIAKLSNGDQVTFKSTTTSLDSGQYVVATKNAGAHTFTVAKDLTALPAKLTGVGTVTKLA
jgi:hypothetical protein